MPKSKCPTKWKRDWETRAKAQEVAKRLRSQGARGQEAYQCPEGHWHVGNGGVKRHAAAMRRKRRR